MNRRSFLSLLAIPSLGSATYRLTKEDDEFLEDLSRRAFLYFWEQSDPQTGLVLDRVRATGTRLSGRHSGVASTANTGFYLSALCIGAMRRWMDPNAIRERVRANLRHLLYAQQNVRGWYYHFADIKSGERTWASEVSSIDTAFLMAGVITAGQYFAADAEISNMAALLFERIDFEWMTDRETGFLRMGWTPEKGYLRAEWVDYRENAILALLAIASPSNPISERVWSSFERDQIELAGYRFVGRGPIFTHQYSQAWMELRDLRDGPPWSINYFENSAVATRAFRDLSIGLRGLYPSYSENLWGVTPSDSETGYVIWGYPTSRRDLDGTVVPCAAAGSLMFTPDICLAALRYMREQFGAYIYGRYGFSDAFHPLTMWVNPDVIGIDLGITLLSAENLRSGSVWNWFSRSPDVQRAMSRIFRPAFA